MNQNNQIPIPRLTEIGVKSFLKHILKNCNDFRINYFNIVFNFSLLFIFFIILGIVLIIKYKGKLTPEEQEEKNMETKTYIL